MTSTGVGGAGAGGAGNWNSRGNSNNASGNRDHQNVHNIQRSAMAAQIGTNSPGTAWLSSMEDEGKLLFSVILGWYFDGACFLFDLSVNQTF